MPLQFLDAVGGALDLSAEFRYHPEDPLAITLLLTTGLQEVTWVFGRDLLITGRHEPAGEGDVRVWPCLDEDGVAVVVIELLSPDGELATQARSRDIDDFVSAMVAAVPLGAELPDIDGMVSQLLG